MYCIRSTDSFKRDLKKLQKEDAKLVKKVEELVESIRLDYKKGIGKPERLKGFEDLEVYSRRINKKHRIVYRYDKDEDCVFLITCYGHYGDK